MKKPSEELHDNAFNIAQPTGFSVAMITDDPEEQVSIVVYMATTVAVAMGTSEDSTFKVDKGTFMEYVSMYWDYANQTFDDFEEEQAEGDDDETE